MPPEDLTRIERRYMEQSDWQIKENANVNLSYSGFIGYLLDNLLKDPEILSSYLPSSAVKAHIEGDIHIHKLPHSLFIPYCIGWSFGSILRKGLVTPSIVARPAKHLETAISHLVSFFFLASQEWTGAQAISALDLYLSPFVRTDNLDNKSVKQALQRLVYELNYPSRLGYQSPFTNITILLDTIPEFLRETAIVGGKKVGILEDFLEEAQTITKNILTHYLEGDSKGKPFTFPIVTMMITKKFDWNGSRWDGLTDEIFNLIAKRGTIYLLNGYATNIDALYAMCCRLTIDVDKVLSLSKMISIRSDLEELTEELRKHKQAYGVWALPDATGSIGVVTINLPRIAISSFGDESEFFDELQEKIHLAKEVLLVWRERYNKLLERGFMPLTRIYLGTFVNHFNTIGLVGLPEAAANFLQNKELWFDSSFKERKEAMFFMKKVVKCVRDLTEEFEEESGHPWNVEEVPAESTAYRLASLDYKLFKEKLKNEFFIPNLHGVSFYSNSITPYYANLSLAERLKIEGEVQREFTGGVMLHIFLYESPDVKSLKKFVYNIVKNTKLVYFSITPSISVCLKCGWWGVGIYTTCMKCQSKNIEIWSRIVGYYRPLHRWNKGRRAEFLSRIHYSFLRKNIKPINILDVKEILKGA